jgi:ATP-binding cassette subfamily B protein
MNISADNPREARARVALLAPAWGFLRPYWPRVLGASLALVFTASVTLSLGQGLRMLVDQGFVSGSAEQLNRAVLVFMLIVLLLAIGTFTRFYLVSWIGERVTADLRRAVFDHVLSLHPGFFETNGAGEIQSRITADTTLLQTVIGSSVSIALRNLLTLAGGVVLLFVSNPRLTGIVLLSVPLVLLPIVVFGRRVRTLSRDSQDRLANAGAYLSEALGNIKTVQAFNHEGVDRERFAMHVEDTFRASIRRVVQRSWLTAMVIVLVLGAVGAMIWVGGNDVIAGRTTPGELTAFIFYAVMVAAAAGALSEVIGDLQRAAGATERLMELLREAPLIRAPADPLALPARLRGEIELTELRFAYPSNPDRPAIDGITLHVPAGSSVALVGASGAGKSTLVDLLLRFYEPDGGSIRLDGIETRRVDPQALRRHFALVPQQPVLFTGSVLDNIRYGVPGASEEAVMAAARAAFAEEFIARLPEGYASFVGEGGVRLSGGQRQRIAIARALLRDPAILLLDEATSALDADSEAMVQQALAALMQGRTTLVIAHRLATVRRVDRIVVLEQGRIAATGSHDELLAASPLYARWAALQFVDEGRPASG